MTTASKDLRELEAKVDAGFEMVQKELAAQRREMSAMENRLRGEMSAMAKRMADEMFEMKTEIITEILNVRNDLSGT